MSLVTPIHLKTDENWEQPEGERASYLLAGNGLYICRRHRFFTSCVKTDRWPSELPDHKSTLRLNYPILPAALLEKVAGFFSVIAERHNSEAAVIMAWDNQTNQIELIIPEQNTGGGPMSVHYEIPDNIPPHQEIIGDIHSHVYFAAFSSATDTNDETHRPGLHIVIGKLGEEPPEFHVEAVVDGLRFSVKPEYAMEVDKYRARSTNTPKAWIKKVKIVKPKPIASWRAPGYAGQHSWGGMFLGILAIPASILLAAQAIEEIRQELHGLGQIEQEHTQKKSLELVQKIKAAHGNDLHTKHQ